MIKTIAELLSQIKEKESELLKDQNIDHTGIIGDMYEGLTAELMQKSIPNNIDIRVVKGQIENSDGKLTNQIDCMIVIGEGKKIPYTDNYSYNIHNVIAVIEVKKNLYTSEMKDSYENLHSVVDRMETENVPLDLNKRKLYSDAYKNILSENIPTEDEYIKLSKEKQYFNHLLRIEAALPVRIVLGYYGLKTEASLRNKFIQMVINNNILNGKVRFSPIYFPDIIIAENNSLLKLKGMPYASPITNDNLWTFFASTNTNPFLIILEFIFTRISYLFNIPSHELFGQDLETESLNPFIKGKIISTGNLEGWEYQYYDFAEKDLRSGFSDWCPETVTKEMYEVFVNLCNVSKIDLNSDEFLEFLKNNSLDKQKFLDDMKNTNLIQLKKDNIQLLYNNLLCVIFEDKYLVADDGSGKFSNWLFKQQNQKMKTRHDA